MTFRIDQLEYVACDFCGADTCTTRHEKRGFSIVQCNRCGLVYTNPRLKQENIAALYDADYFQGHGFDSSIDYVADIEKHVRGENSFTLDDWDIQSIRALLSESQNQEPYSLLEIGCGTGVFLNNARKHGFDCRGLESSGYAADFAKQTGIPVETKSIEEASYPLESLDVIIMREVVEHLPHPLESLKAVYSWLKPGGVLFLSTGNYDCPERKLRGSAWSYFMPEGHLFYFSNRTMRSYLAKAGFQTINVTNQGDKLMNMLMHMNIITADGAQRRNLFKRAVFTAVRCINHFISSGMRIYATKEKGPFALAHGFSLMTT